MTILSLPPACSHICNDCPWDRTSLPGWLGPMGATDWVALAHSEEPIACHETIKKVGLDGVGDWSDPRIKQCRGAAVFRRNIAKRSRHPDAADRVVEADRVNVFANDAEFVAYHTDTFKSNVTHFEVTPLRYVWLCFECGTETDIPEHVNQFEIDEYGCDICRERDKDDVFIGEPLAVFSCPSDDFEKCEDENHHWGHDGEHWVSIERS